MKSIKMLLVEDSASDIRLIQEALKDGGVPVQLLVARDGMEAMDILRGSERVTPMRPDVILLDLNLPRKNGREVLAEIKSSPALKHIPVLVMTSSRADEDVAQCYSLNANCYITKPNDLDDYINVVRTIEDFWFGTVTLPESFHVGRMRSTAFPPNEPTQAMPQGHRATATVS